MTPDAPEGPGLRFERVARYRLAARFAGGKRVLDVAPELGDGAVILAQAGASEVTGIGTDSQAIQDAASRCVLPNVRFRVDDVSRLATVTDGSADLFVCLEAIAEPARVEDLVRQAARVLAPEGLLILSIREREVGRRQAPSTEWSWQPVELAALLRTTFPYVEIFHQRTCFAGRVAEFRPDGTIPSVPPGTLRVAMDDPREDSSSAPSLVAFASLAPVRMFPFTESDTAAEHEQRSRHIRRLEATVAERDAQIRDLQMAIERGEMRFALAIVRAMKRADRLLQRVPSRLARRLLRARRVMTGAVPPSPRATGGPLFSVVLPVYENLEFLRGAIDSVLAQTFRDFECVIYDDASPDPRVREVLEGYRGHAGVRLDYGTENLGISRAANRALALAAGRYVAFLDSDDLLEPNALERAARFL